MKKTTVAVIVLSLFITFSWIVPREAHALTITPIRYEIAGNPGEVLEQKMTLVNETKKSQLLYVSFSNFEAQGDTGSPTFVEPKEGLGTWISTSQSTVNLGAGEQKVINFKIEIPKDAEPGGHFAAIFWGTNPSAKAGEVSIGTKTGLLLLLSVKGDVKESAGLSDFQTVHDKWFYKYLPVGFEYRFSNQGGDRVKPVGSIVVRSVLGWKVKDVNANPNDGNVLPTTTRKFMTEWSKQDSVDVRDKEEEQQLKYNFGTELKKEWNNFAFGIFRAKLEAEFGSNVQALESKSIYFMVIPFELLLVILIIGIPVFFILRTILRRYNRSVIKNAEKRFAKE